MTKRLMIAVTMAALMLTVRSAWAHEEYRIIGTVLKVSTDRLAVKQTKDGKTFSMLTDSQTIYTRDKKKVKRADLKVGTNVVVDGIGDTIEDLLVLEVKIVPPPAKK
jgi:hypothetical protein